MILFFQYFKRDADELESWIYEKLQAASDESYKDPTNLQVRMEFYVCLGVLGFCVSAVF
jgi:spectrin alpha